MEGSLVNSKRELIELKNGYFRYLYNDVQSITANQINQVAPLEFKFGIPPLNEMAFSGRYSQSIARIRSCYIYNLAESNWNERFMNLTDHAVGATPVVYVKTSIPTRNMVQFVGSDGLEGDGLVGDSGDTKIMCEAVMTSGKNMILDTDENPVGGAQDGLAEKIFLNGGATRQARGTGDTTAPRITADLARNVWTYEDKTSIWDSGVLCSIPFGGDFTVSIRDDVNRYLAMVGANDSVLINSTRIRLELEIQMLPNPTS